jgi:organic hydroperoxide reductase OsmC/OhrA
VVAALSACHMLWVLHFCADAGIVVTAYEDRAEGVGEDRFTEVVLRPKLTIENSERAGELGAIHHRAHAQCWIANSMNFPVRVEPANTH